jgi:hypothetical protein
VLREEGEEEEVEVHSLSTTVDIVSVVFDFIVETVGDVVYVGEDGDVVDVVDVGDVYDVGGVGKGLIDIDIDVEHYTWSVIIPFVRQLSFISFCLSGLLNRE